MNAMMSLQRLALPLTAAQLAFAANTFVTNLFLARHSTTALHASLPGSMLAVAVSSFAISSLGYSATVFADRHGSGDTPGALAAFRAALVLAALSIPAFILAAPAGHALLGVFNTAPEILAAESAYYDILLANGYFTMLAAVLGGYFTGQGHTRFVGAVATFGFLLNMAIAPAFINGLFGAPASGIRGAGLSATVSHIVPCLVLAVAICRRPIECKARRMRRADFRTLLSLGIPNGVRAVIDIGGFFVYAAVLAECEGAAVAASTAAFAVNGIYQSFPQGLAQALEITTARAAQENRRALLAPALKLVAIHSLAFAAVLAAAGGPALGVFAAKGDAAFAAGFSAVAKTLVVILGAKAVFESAVQVLQAHLRGCGETAAVFRIQCATSLLFWIPLFFVVRACAPGIRAYWLTMLASSALASAALLKHLAAVGCRNTPL